VSKLKILQLIVFVFIL